MPSPGFRVIRGSFHIRGYKPDGDSVRFTAENPARFDGLYRDFKDISPTGDFQLRLEGIDAPETHYGLESQPYGDNSRDRLISLLGFNRIERAAEKIIDSTPEQMPGVILTKGFDPHGRPISYALPGASAQAAQSLADGNELEVPVELLAQTINARMVQEGYAYPLLYASTPDAHRGWLRAQAQAARMQKLGVWAHDSTPAYELVDRSSICAGNGTLIFPKFFRRSIDYLRQASSGDFKGDFASWLAATPTENDQVLVSEVPRTLSQLFQQHNGRVTCLFDVLDMVFIEK
jgi:endonuclease YncB( thermonuclease family)